MMRAGITVLRFSDREVLGQLDVVLEKNMGIFVILKISPCPSFPKRGCKRVHSNV
jgi:hypothetical protein